MTGMVLTEKDNCFIYDGIFPDGVIAGFTKPSLEGRHPYIDTPTALSFLEREIDVSYMKQVHGAVVHRVNLGGMYVGDGLITGSKGLTLAVKTADCMPVILSSHEMGVTGVVHMGWRSAKDGILENVGDDLSTFVAASGPALRKCCYEVGREFFEYERVKPFLEERDGRIFFDSVSFVKNELMKRGLKEENFFDAGLCSFCSPGAFHSHRRTKTKNRTISFILDTRA
jgi:YfiH family protein